MRCEKRVICFFKRPLALPLRNRQPRTSGGTSERVFVCELPRAGARGRAGAHNSRRRSLKYQMTHNTQSEDGRAEDLQREYSPFLLRTNGPRGTVTSPGPSPWPLIPRARRKRQHSAWPVSSHQWRMRGNASSQAAGTGDPTWPCTQQWAQPQLCSALASGRVPHFNVKRNNSDTRGGRGFVGLVGR